MGNRTAHESKIYQMSVLAIRPYTLTFTYLLIYLGLYYMERLPHLRRKVRAKHQFD